MASSSNAKRAFDEITAIPAVAEARKLLAARLPPTLRYHTAQHTDDVLQEALSFAAEDGVAPAEVRLLGIAAAFHDAGFIEQPQNNEAIAARLALEAMRREGAYSKADESAVETMILDSRVQLTPQGARQVPTTALSRYLLDGDVSNLGRDDFFDKAELVREEVGVLPPKEFYSGLVMFMRSHTWYTPAAKKLREKKKQQNLERLLKRVKDEGWG